MSLRLLFMIAIMLLLPAAMAGAVIIDSATGTGNTTAPPDDPGWSHVGRRGGTTAIYLGHGWAITARHVGEGTIRLGGVDYPPVPGSEIEIDHGAGEVADIVLFRCRPRRRSRRCRFAAARPRSTTRSR